MAANVGVEYDYGTEKTTARLAGTHHLTAHDPRSEHGSPKHGGPDRLLMFLIFSFIVMVLLRVFVLFP